MKTRLKKIISFMSRRKNSVRHSYVDELKILKEKEQLMSNMLDLLPGMVFAKDIRNNYNFTLWNRAAEQMTGVKAKDCLGKSDYDFFPKEQADFFRAADIAASRSVGVIEIPEEDISTTTGIIKARTLKAVLRDANQNPTHLLGIAIDVTEEKRLYRQLVESQKLLEEAQRVANIGSWSFHAGTQEISWSKQMFVIFSEDSTLGAPSYEKHASTVHPDDRTMWKQTIEQCLADGKPFHIRFRTVVSDKETWVSAHGEAWKDESGNIAGLRGTCQDVTDLVLAENSLLAERAKAIHTSKLASLGEMYAGLAHEINNPLAVITVLAHAIARHANDPNKVLEKIATLEKSAEKIVKIVDGFRRFSRGTGKSEHLPHQLSHIVEEAVHLTALRAKRYEVLVQVQIKIEGNVICDEIEVEQVLVNLINNSIDAVKALSEKWIRICLFEESDTVVLQVWDSGNGIPEKVRRDIFKPFFTTKAVGEGTGLGLSIVKGIIDQHNATISVLPHAENTCFEIRFPQSSVSTDHLPKVA